MPDERFETDGIAGVRTGMPELASSATVARAQGWGRGRDGAAPQMLRWERRRRGAMGPAWRAPAGASARKPGGEPSAPLSRFDPPTSRKLADICIPYQCFEEPAPAGIARATTGSGPESARHDAGGIDLPEAVEGGAWTKLPAKSTTYGVTLVKLIIGGRPPPASAEVQFLTAGEESEGQRLDNFLIRVLKGVPKTHVYRIIRSGEVRVNKGRAAADTRIAVGDVVRLPPVRLSEAAAAKTEKPAPAREFPALFEDDHVLAVDKPAGVAVHGGSGVSFGVIEQLRQARPAARFLELVHRLDRETSGILLLAKKRSALTRLQDQFRERETGKTYLALVTGAWPANKKVIDQPLHKYLQADGERRVRVVARDDPDGMRAITLVKVSQLLPPPLGDGWGGGPPGFILLEVTIKTARTHKIRGHPATPGH